MPTLVHRVFVKAMYGIQKCHVEHTGLLYNIPPTARFVREFAKLVIGDRSSHENHRIYCYQPSQVLFLSGVPADGYMGAEVSVSGVFCFHEVIVFSCAACNLWYRSNLLYFSVSCSNRNVSLYSFLLCLRISQGLRWSFLGWTVDVWYTGGSRNYSSLHTLEKC